MRTTKIKLTIVAMAAAACIAPMAPVVAGITESFWIAPRGGNFHDARNWDGGIPDEEVVAIFDLNASYSVVLDADAVSDRVIVRSGEVTMDLTEHAYDLVNRLESSPSITVADQDDAIADLTLRGGLLDAQFISIADASASEGALALTDAIDVAASSHVQVGYQGFGVLDIGNESSLLSDFGVIGVNELSVGAAFVEGKGSSWTMLSSAIVGQQGTGELDVLDGATVSSATGIVGQQAGSFGRVIVDGQGSTWHVDGPLDIGQEGLGILDIRDGGIVTTSSFVTLGTFPAGGGQDPFLIGTGEAIISGPGAIWEVDGDLYLGFLGYGRWTLSGGGRVAVGGDVIRGDWIPGDPAPQMVVQLASADDYREPALSALGSIDEFEVHVELINAFVPQVGDSFFIAEAAGGIGEFHFTFSQPPPFVDWIIVQVDGVVQLFIGSSTPLGDLDGDGVVDANDLITLLGAWGPCDNCEFCPADLDGDCVVAGSDLILLLGNWS